MCVCAYARAAGNGQHVGTPPCISGLTAALPWQTTWSAQILSAPAWAQVALASDFPRMAVVRALHKSVRRVYSVSPWCANNTMRAIYAIAHHQPCKQHQAVTRLILWLNRNAKWDGSQYTNIVIPPQFQPEGYCPAWCVYMHLLRVRGRSEPYLSARHICRSVCVVCVCG